MVTRFVAERINPAIINKTKIDNQLEREILGQIKDPRKLTLLQYLNFLNLLLLTLITKHLDKQLIKR